MNEKKASYGLISMVLATLGIIPSLVGAQYPGEGAAFALGTACIMWVVLWLVIWILIAIWVYKDAERRGKSGVLWLIVVILLGLIGIIIWLLVRPPIQQVRKPMRICPNCGAQIPMEYNVCPHCGAQIPRTPPRQ